jgi:hypothetical protein
VFDRLVRRPGVSKAAGLALFATAAALPVPAGAAAPSRCSAPKSRTVLQTHRIRVYSVPADERNLRQRWSCNLTTGRRIELDDPEVIFSFPPPAMATAGDLLAFGVTGQEEANSYTQIEVIDTRAPDPDVTFHPVLLESSTFGGAANRIGGIVLRPNRAVAWIACQFPLQAPIDGRIGPECRHPGADTVVAAVPSNKKNRVVLDSGTDIDPTSLRRHGYRISWVRAGKRKTVRLK